MSEFESFEKEQKKAFDLGEAINQSFEIYKKIALPGGLGLLLIMAILSIASVSGIGFFVDIESFSEKMKNFKPETLSFQENLIYIGVITIITALISPFIAGLQKMCHEADQNEEVRFSSIWFYVNSDRFIHIVLATSLITLITTAINNYLTSSMPLFGNLLAICITFPISVLTFIMLPLILFEGLNAIQAISKSTQLVSKNFFTVLILLLLGYIFAFVGLIAFCVGIIFTMPIIYAVQYTVYKNLS